MEDILTPSGHASSFEKARNRLAFASFMVSVIAILLSAYLSVQREANETSLQKANAEAARLEAARVRLFMSDSEFVIKALDALVHSVCVSQEERRRYNDELPGSSRSHKWNTAMSLLQRQVRPSKMVRYCRHGYEPLGGQILTSNRSIPIKNWQSAGSSEEQIQVALQALPPSDLRVLQQHVSPPQLATVLDDLRSWEKRRTWVLDDEFPLSPGIFDKLPERYGPSQIEGLFDLSGSVFVKSRYLNSAMATQTANELKPILDEEISRAYANVDRWRARMEPASDAASIGGLQVPASIVIRLLVLPAAFVYALYWLYSVRTEEELVSQGVHSIRDKTFWFPRLSAPQDPLSRPMPKSMRELLPRIVWFSFHFATLLFLLLAIRFKIGSTASWVPFNNSIERWLNAAALLLCFWLSRCATTGSAEKITSAQVWTYCSILISAIAAIITTLLLQEIPFDRANLFFNFTLGCTLTALLWWRLEAPSNFSIMAWLISIGVIWYPYVRVIAGSLAS